MKDANEDQLNRLSWFEKGKSISYIRQYLEQCKYQIRIATGFFTIRGWELIRVYTKQKKIHILVGLEDPGKERARMALINDIMQDLRTGFDKDRRKAVRDLVNKIQSKQFGLVDARARDHHNKLYIFDKNHAIQTSSNLTGKGLIYQVEGGNIINDEEEIHQLIVEFDEYFKNAEDLTLSLLDVLLKWLELCTPWHIYLKTLLALESLKPVKTTYSKNPLIYQKDMVSLTLSQIYKFGGSMLVASTGLGKTIIGTLVAIQLKHQDLIDKIIVICPNAVKSSWSREMQDASLCAIFLTVETLDKEGVEDIRLWEDALKALMSGRSRFLLIFDESHKLRKRYPDNYGNKYRNISERRERKAFSRINNFVNNLNNKGNVKVLLLTGSPYATEY